jgi:hypothetical protein
LLGHLDDGTIALAISGTRQLSTAWARLPAGGMLRLEWPLPRAALGIRHATPQSRRRPPVSGSQGTDAG